MYSIATESTFENESTNRPIEVDIQICAIKLQYQSGGIKSAATGGVQFITVHSKQLFPIYLLSNRRNLSAITVKRNGRLHIDKNLPVIQWSSASSSGGHGNGWVDRWMDGLERSLSTNLWSRDEDCPVISMVIMSRIGNITNLLKMRPHRKWSQLFLDWRLLSSAPVLLLTKHCSSISRLVVGFLFCLFLLLSPPPS